MKTMRLIMAGIVSASLLGGSAVAQGLLLSEDFQTNPTNRGWLLTGQGEWRDAAAEPDAQCIVATAGTWAGPRFEVTPFQYYEVRFRSRADGKTYWLTDFFDRDGAKSNADHYSCFERSTNWVENVYCFRARHNSTQAQLIFQSIADKTFRVDDISIRPVSRAEVVRWADSVYAKIPPVSYAAPADRWRLIPRTLESLQEGRPLKVVMLGDSIVNDTANSAFETRLDAMYPAAASNQFIISIRGSTGCRFYQDDANLKPCVLDHHPDLLIIGGISNGDPAAVGTPIQEGDPEAVRTVIRKVRASTSAEILLLTGAVGRINPLAKPEWQPGVDGQDYKSRLCKMAQEEQVEFLDMESPWGDYIRHAGQPWEYFTRDELHASEQGRQVLAYILTRYFEPEK